MHLCSLVNGCDLKFNLKIRFYRTVKLGLCRVKTVVLQDVLLPLDKISMSSMELFCGILSWRMRHLNYSRPLTVLLRVCRQLWLSARCWPSALPVVLFSFLMRSRHCAGALVVLQVSEQNMEL